MAARVQPAAASSAARDPQSSAASGSAGAAARRLKPRGAAALLCAALLFSACATGAAGKGGAAALPSDGAQGAARRSAAYASALAEQRPGPQVSRVGALSDYVSSLSGTNLDSPVFFIEPSKPVSAPAPAILILGGTHGDEIAGVVTASLFASWARPVEARLIVIPRANASAALWPDPVRAGPSSVAIPGMSGSREFHYGSRYTNPRDENRADPLVYLPPDAGTGEGLPPSESRNLNRNYPGSGDGSLTSRAAAAIFTIIKKENVRAAFDLHEAGPSSGLAWDIVAHPKCMAYAASGAIAAADRGINMVLDRSAPKHKGFSHHEWGDRTDTAAYLIETLNPGQVTGGLPGLDQMYNEKSPLMRRVGIQIETVLAILEAQGDAEEPRGWTKIEGMPTLDELEANFASYF